eukprot:Rmarinus@m.29734
MTTTVTGKPSGIGATPPRGKASGWLRRRRLPPQTQGDSACPPCTTRCTLRPSMTILVIATPMTTVAIPTTATATRPTATHRWMGQPLQSSRNRRTQRFYCQYTVARRRLREGRPRGHSRTRRRRAPTAPPTARLEPSPA